MDVTTGGSNRRDGYDLVGLYRELKLKLTGVLGCDEAGILKVSQRMNSGRLKVFRPLENFFHEYRLYRRNEHGQVMEEQNQLMNCLRLLCVSGEHQMRTKPIEDTYPYRSRPGFPGSWVAY